MFFGSSNFRLNWILLIALIVIAPSLRAVPVSSLGYTTSGTIQNKSANFDSDMLQGWSIQAQVHGCRWAPGSEIFVFDEAVVYTEFLKTTYDVYPISYVLSKGCSLPYMNMLDAPEITSVALEKRVSMEANFRTPKLSDLGFVVDGKNHPRPSNFVQAMHQGIQITQNQHVCTWASRPYIYVFADGVIYANADKNDYNIFATDKVRANGCELPDVFAIATNPESSDCSDDSMGAIPCDSMGTDVPITNSVPFARKEQVTPASENYSSIVNSYFGFCAIRADGSPRCVESEAVTASGIEFVPPLLKKVKSIALGLSACAVSEEGRVVCWGSNIADFKVLPELTIAKSSLEVAVNGLGACALKADKSVRCWGPYVQSVPADLGAVKSILGKDGDFCAILEADSTLRCWGTLSNLIPKDLGAVKKFYWDYTLSSACAILADDTLRCFIPTFPGATGGIADVPAELGPVVDVSLYNINGFAGNISKVCAVGKSGKTMCWGQGATSQWAVLSESGVKQVTQYRTATCALFTNGEYRCLDNESKVVDVPAAAPTARIIVTGPASVCAINADGNSFCFGKNPDMERPMLLVDTSYDLNAITDQNIALGDAHSCFLQGGYIICNGANNLGQGRALPSIDDGDNVRVVAGSQHSCVLRTDNSIKCWGGNQFDQAKVPVDLPPSRGLVAGSNHTCAISSDKGLVRCWGDSQDNQLAVPAGFENVTKIRAGKGHTCAMTSRGKMKCWGRNAEGQSNVPSDLEIVSDIAVGGNHSCAITSDNRLHCWGDNSFGELTPPASLGFVTEVEAGDGYTCAIRAADNKLFCWGRDDFNQTKVPPSAEFNLIRTSSTLFDSAVSQFHTLLCGISGAAANCRFHPGSLYSFNGFQGVDEDYDLKIKYANSCQLESGNGMFLMIDNASTPNPVFQRAESASGGEVTFKKLKGPVNLYGGATSGSSNIPVKSGFRVTNPSYCSFYLESVTIVPGETTLAVWRERAGRLLEQLTTSFKNWLELRNINDYQGQSVDKLKQNLAVQRDAIVEQIAGALYLLNGDPKLGNPNADSIQPEDVLNATTNLEQANLKMDNTGSMAPSMVREFKPVSQWPLQWRQLLEANRDPTTDRLFADAIDSSITNYMSLIAYLRSQQEPVGNLTAAEALVKSKIDEVKNFLMQAVLVKDGLVADLAEQIKELLEMGRSDSRAACKSTEVDSEGFSLCS